MVALNTAQKNKAIKDYTVGGLVSFLEEAGAVQIGDYSYAIPQTVEGEQRYSEVKITSKNNKDTKTTFAFNPAEVRAAWLAEKKSKEDIATAAKALKERKSKKK